MNNTNINFQDQRPVPLLYVENVTILQLQWLAKIFSLEIQDTAGGHLLHKKSDEINFKFHYLDLFFAGMTLYLKNQKVKFFLFEKNILREELEIGILGSISRETSNEYQIEQWRHSQQSFSFSGFAQAALFQSGFLTKIEEHVIAISEEELKQMITSQLETKSQRVA